MQAMIQAMNTLQIPYKYENNKVDQTLFLCPVFAAPHRQIEKEDLPHVVPQRRVRGLLSQTLTEPAVCIQGEALLVICNGV